MSPYKMRIDTCESGREAVEMVQRNRYDIVFMDHLLPEMDGIEVTKALRALHDDSGYFQNVPVVALTANAVVGMKEMFLENGMSDYLDKPIDISKLAEILMKWIPSEKHDMPNPAEHVPAVRQDETAAAPPEKRIPGIDMQLGVSLNGGKQELFIETLEVFYEDGFEKITQLKDALDKNDLKSYRILIHVLKSASMSIGAQILPESAKSLEIAAREGSLDYITKINEKFLAELEMVLNNIREFLATGKEL
jgi:CheY-like chemotaxis protein